MIPISDTAIFPIPPAQQWAVGCPRCTYGMLAPVPALRGDMPLYQERAVQWHSGALRLCNCPAGECLHGFLEESSGRKQAEEREMAEMPSRMAARRNERIFQSAGVPARYAAYTLDGFIKLAGADPGKRDAILALRQYAEAQQVTYKGETKGGILLWGAPGMGKTGSLAPLFTDLVRTGASGLWVQYNELMAQMKRFEDGHVDERMNACQSVAYLFIDDFGDPSAQKTATDYAREVIFRIVDYRTSRNMPMFVTTNLDPDKLQNQYDARIARRLLSACAAIHVGGKVLS